MKKIYFLLAVLLLLTGCGKEVLSTPTAIPASHPTEALIPTEEPVFPLTSFDIYVINDLHGRLMDTDTQPGLDELSTYLEQAQDSENAILLSTGDMWQGTSESSLTKGAIITEWMNELNFAAMTLGGHEFDWGEEQIRQNKQLAQFPFLGINVYSRTTNAQADYCQSSRVVEIEGVQIGIIGAIGDCYGSIASAHTKDVYFKTGDALTVLVKAEAERLRSQGVDFIIYALHDGTDQTTGDKNAQPVESRELAGYYDTVLSEGYVDVVFEADSHYWYVLTDPKGVYHLQAGGNNQGISHVQVFIDKHTGDTYILTAELLPASTYQFMDDHPVVARLLEKYSGQIGSATRSLGNNRYYRSGDDICRLVAQLYCTKGVEKWGAQYDIVLAGGYLSCRSPGYLPQGEVTYSQIQSLLPFDNPITLCSIRGRDLTARFLETENKAYHIHTTAYGDSIRDQIDPDGIYYVITDSYTADYAYNHMTTVATYDKTTFARDLIANYITEGGLA